MQRSEIATRNGPVSVVDFGGPAAAPRLHFLHATGLNAQAYARLLAPLAAQFRVIASDARGHGMTRLVADPAALIDWQIYADDLTALLAAVDGDARWLLAGHSMGAAVSLQVAAEGGAAGLAMFDPAILPFALAPAYEAARRLGQAPASPLAEQARRRRRHFASHADAHAAYAGRGMFRSWADADLEAYLAGGLVPAGDGVDLACTPEWEAATFTAVDTAAQAHLAVLAVPFVVLAAETQSTVADADLSAMAAQPHCLVAERVAQTSHFLPFERPDAAAAAIVRVADAAFGA